MLFNSSTFIAFALLFYTTFFLLHSQRSRLLLLAGASLLFYSWWDWRFTFLLIGSGLVDFSAALALVAWPRWRRPLLAAALTTNLGVLFAFKYAGFTLSLVGSALEFDPASTAIDIVLPVGISFYTFQSMSYTIDVYRGVLRPTRSVVQFFAYLAMFPQLVAGPIERGAALLEQLGEKRQPTPTQCWDGWGLIVLGYFQKCAIADNLAPYVDEAFANVSQHESGPFWWLVAAMFAVQIYFDFSGYSHIARGLAKFMGLELMQNFNSPYLAVGLKDFWGRWHISLSTWFRDYVYVPLGGSRVSPLRAHANLWITMLASGLWHGAGLTFLAWGAFHALLLSVERLTSWPQRLASLGWVGVLAARALTLPLVLASWVLFRAASLAEAGVILSRMFAWSEWRLPESNHDCCLLALLAGVCVIAAEAQWRRAAAQPSAAQHSAANWRYWAIPAAVVAVIFLRGTGHAFYYFQF